MSKFERQARSFGTRFVYEEVASIKEESQGQKDRNELVKNFKIKTTGNNEYRASGIVLAFGKTPRDLSVPGEQQLKGKGVSYRAVCDGPLSKQKRVAVVGIGDPSLDTALFLW